MSHAFMAEFDNPDALLAAATRIGDDGYRVIDAFTPFPMPALEPLLTSRPTQIRAAMLIAALVTAALAFALQWYSAVIDYPINSGGRPLNSWPVFLLVPFEVAMLAAALAGLAAFLWECGLPRLHHELFEVVGFERATQDRFFLLASDPRDDDAARMRASLRELGALGVARVRS